MIVKGYELVTSEKVERALNGTQTGNGTILGGIGGGAYLEGDEWKKNGTVLSEEKRDELETALLAEYDKLGGLITKNGDKVKTGSFYDVSAKRPRDTPAVVLTYTINGEVVEVPEEEETPGIVKAAKIQKEKKSKAK